MDCLGKKRFRWRGMTKREGVWTRHHQDMLHTMAEEIHRMTVVLIEL